MANSDNICDVLTSNVGSEEKQENRYWIQQWHCEYLAAAFLCQTIFSHRLFMCVLGITKALDPGLDHKRWHPFIFEASEFFQFPWISPGKTLSVSHKLVWKRISFCLITDILSCVPCVSLVKNYYNKMFKPWLITEIQPLQHGWS